jgi:ubiquinone/menaquinone biosynthesis C-methylase UbiE
MLNKEESIAKAEIIFNSAADYFDAPALSFWNRFGQRTVDLSGVKGGDRVLDVCCGTGASVADRPEL